MSEASDNGTWVYFLLLTRQNGTELCKIGRSAQARDKRRQSFEKDLSAWIEEQKWELLAEVRADPKDEKVVQRYFAEDLRDPERSDEIFRSTPRLAEYVRWLRDNYYVITDEDSDAKRDACPQVDSSLWLPRPERRKKYCQRNGELPLDAPRRSILWRMGTREVTTEDFYTPLEILECARVAMGGIDLDPATHVYANEAVRATRIYTVSDNGLEQPWEGRVWLNPPYGEWNRWAPKLRRELASGSVQQLCCLVATRTLTAQYFHSLLRECAALVIFNGRLRFRGSLASSPDDGHAVLYFGKRVDEFRGSFAELGAAVFTSATSLKEVDNDATVSSVGVSRD